MFISPFIQLEDGHTLFDYSVGLNDLVQLMVRAAPLGENKVQQNQIEDEDKKPNDGYDSSGEESTCSDKENKDKENKLVFSCHLIILKRISYFKNLIFDHVGYNLCLVFCKFSVLWTHFQLKCNPCWD